MFFVAFLIELVGTSLFVLTDPTILEFTVLLGEMFFILAILISVAVVFLIFHFEVVFGFFCLRWREFPDEHKSEFRIFGILGIILSVVLCFLLGGLVDWIGGVVSLTASLLILIVSMRSAGL
jgi:hypothetical protein